VIDKLGGADRVLRTGAILAAVAAVASLTKSFYALGKAMLAAGIGGGAAGVTKWGLIKGLGATLGLITAIYLMVDSIATWVQGGDSWMGTIVGKDFESWKKDFQSLLEMDWEDWKITLMALAEDFGNLLEESATAFGQWLMEGLTGVADWFKILADDFITWILEGFERIGDWFKILAQAFVEAIRSALSSIPLVGKYFKGEEEPKGQPQAPIIGALSSPSPMPDVGGTKPIVQAPITLDNKVYIDGVQVAATTQTTAGGDAAMQARVTANQNQPVGG
jgi:hypothetical protein